MRHLGANPFDWRIGPRHALAGGALATLLFECAKYAIAYYLKRASYQQIYGALAAIPIFLLWIWVSWLVVLLGATFTAALSAFDHQPPSAADQPLEKPAP